MNREISRCRHYEAMEEARREQTIDMRHVDGRQYKLIFTEAPGCAGCGNSYCNNSGIPCRVSVDLEVYKGGKYKRRADLAARKICKLIARERRHEKWLSNYAAKQTIRRWLRQNPLMFAEKNREETEHGTGI